MPLQHPHMLAVRLGKAALLLRLALPLSLPGKMPVFPRSLPPSPPRLLLPCLHRKAGDLPIPLTPKQVKPITQQTILGKVAGTPQGKGPPRPPRRLIPPPGKAITPPLPPLGIPRFLLKKNPTLSGSLTFPTNP